MPIVQHLTIDSIASRHNDTLNISDDHFTYVVERIMVLAYLSTSNLVTPFARFDTSDHGKTVHSVTFGAMWYITVLADYPR
jgi:metal-dependent HD superfamily phosphatase/phosphodiesterase